AGGDGVAQLAAVVGAHFLAAVVADGQLGGAAAVVEGIAGGDLDRPAGGVLAVQRALRATQHFDLLDVEQREHRAVDARVVDVVDVHAHAGVEALQRVGLANAADEDVGAVGRAAALHDVEVGHGTLQSGHVAGL